MYLVTVTTDKQMKKEKGTQKNSLNPNKESNSPKEKNLNTPVPGKNILSEPKIVYEKRKWTLKKFDSFEEMNEADAKEMSQLSGEDHLKNATELIKRIYADELKRPMDKKIKFRK